MLTPGTHFLAMIQGFRDHHHHKCGLQSKFVYITILNSKMNGLSAQPISLHQLTFEPDLQKPNYKGIQESQASVGFVLLLTIQPHSTESSRRVLASVLSESVLHVCHRILNQTFGKMEENRNSKRTRLLDQLWHRTREERVILFRVEVENTSIQSKY